MKKYWTIFKISWSRELEYRFNFLMWRLRNIIILVVLYYLWKNLSANGHFAGYSNVELITYVLLANILRAVIFAGQSRLTATEINDGTFSLYLVKPINHFWYVFWRELAQRVLLGLSAVAEVFVFSWIVDARLFWQTDIVLIILFLASLLFSFMLFFVLSYLVSIMSFWSREVMGPRFLFDWLLEMASGSYFPLNILLNSIFISLSFLPFFYIMYVPISIYLGKEEVNFIIKNFAIQLLWITCFAAVVFAVWKKGLKKFTGEGL